MAKIDADTFTWIMIMRRTFGVSRWLGPADECGVTARWGGEGGDGSSSEGNWKEGLCVAAPDPSVGPGTTELSMTTSSVPELAVTPRSVHERMS